MITRQKTQKRLAAGGVILVLFLCAFFSLDWVSHAQNGNVFRREIVGKVRIGKNDGLLYVEMKTNEVVLQFGLGPSPAIEAENFTGWILTSDGETLPYKNKLPEHGEPDIGIRKSGTDISYIFIFFERLTNKVPTAIAIRNGSEFQILPFPKFEIPPNLKGR